MSNEENLFGEQEIKDLIANYQQAKAENAFLKNEVDRLHARIDQLNNDQLAYAEPPQQDSTVDRKYGEVNAILTQHNVDNLSPATKLGVVVKALLKVIYE